MNGRAATIAVVLLLVLSGCTSLEPPVNRGQQPGDRVGGVDSPDDFADPDRDQLGWEGGYWYDEPIDVTTEDGLSDREQAAIINRTAARVEYVRGLEFAEPVPVEVMSREEFRRQRTNESLPEPRRQQLNVTYEALFMINESTDAATVLDRNAGSSVGGYYSPSQNRIVVIGDGPQVLLSNERTLAHELLHAVQDQQFDLTRYDRRTIDRSNALSGLIEGDARFLEHEYREQCQQRWECIATTSGGDAGSDRLANIGPYLITFQPYSDGPSFVRQYYRQGGWSAINQMYADPPRTSSQIIHPDRYPDEQPIRPRVPDRTRGTWERIEVENRSNYAELGEAGINAMLVSPSYDSDGRTEIIPLRHFVNSRDGSADQFDPLHYEHRYTDGLRGDRLVPYRNDAGETGYVWSLAFEDAAEAREFRDGYEQLLRYRNATTVDAAGPGTTYRIDNDDPNGFGAAFRVVQDDERIVLTSAPTVRQLSDVRRPAKRPVSQSVGQPSGSLGQPVSQSVNQSASQSTRRPNGRFAKRQSGRPAGRASDSSTDQFATRVTVVGTTATSRVASPTIDSKRALTTDAVSMPIARDAG